MPYFKKTTKSGNFVEVKIYYATRDGRAISRGPAMRETEAKQEEINEQNARMRLMRLIACNFSGYKADLLIGLSHEHEVTEAQAKAELTEFIKELRKLRKKRGLTPLKYIVTTEKQGRWHHHLITNGGIGIEDLVELWGDRGRKHMEIVDTNSYESLFRIARYLISPYKPHKSKRSTENNKEKRRKHARRWNASRNLEKPIVTKEPIKRPPTDRKPKAPKGCRLLENWYVGADGMGNIFKCYNYLIEEERQQPKKRMPRVKQKQSCKGGG